MTRLADRLGAERAAAVIDAAGGARLTIPADLDHYRETGALERLVGRELAVLLVLHFGGSTIYVPTGGGKRYTRLADIVRMTAEGMSARQIARQIGCSDRTVYARRAAARRLDLL